MHRLGDAPQRVLQHACGPGEVTRLSHDLGHEVTALDSCEPMQAGAGPRATMPEAKMTPSPDLCDKAGQPAKGHRSKRMGDIRAAVE